MTKTFVHHYFHYCYHYYDYYYYLYFNVMTIMIPCIVAVQRLKRGRALLLYSIYGLKMGEGGDLHGV